MSPTVRCAHSPCPCPVTPDEPYCSKSCEHAAEAGEDTCSCGHAVCEELAGEMDPDLPEGALA